MRRHPPTTVSPSFCSRTNIFGLDPSPFHHPIFDCFTVFAKMEGIGLGLTEFPTSLISRPSPRPVFDRLQYAKMEGKAWSILLCE